MVDSIENHGLSYLLELDGEIFPMDNGYWVKFEVKLVSPQSSIPHGIRYSLTLHDRNNKRILGYDNAHGIKSKKSSFKVKKEEWDHKHEKNKIKTYDFKSAAQLLEDFWQSANKIIGTP